MDSRCMTRFAGTILQKHLTHGLGALGFAALLLALPGVAGAQPIIFPHEWPQETEEEDEEEEEEEEEEDEDDDEDDDEDEADDGEDDEEDDEPPQGPPGGGGSGGSPLPPQPSPQQSSNARVILDVFKSARWDKSYGAERASGSAHLDADARMLLLDFAPVDLARAEAGCQASGFISLLGRSAEAARLEADGRVQNNQFNLTYIGGGSYRVDGFTRGGVYDVSGLIRIGGRDIYRPQRHGLIQSSTLVPVDYAPPPLDILYFRYPFSLGPVPCSLTARAGAGAAVRTSFVVNPNVPSLSVSGATSAYANAALDFGVDIGVASAGVTAEGRFANTRGSATIGVSPSGISGTLGVTLEAIRLVFSAWAKLGWGWFSHTWRTTLFEYALAPVSTSRPLL